MEFIYEMSALRLYSKLERKTYWEMSNMVGISLNTLSRYAKGDRLPDIDTLIRICNMLRISVDNFIHHPDVTLYTIEVFMPEEWSPIKFKGNRFEAMRLEKNMDQSSFIKEMREKTGIKTSFGTYQRIKNGEHIGHEFVMAFLKTFNVPLDYLFDDAQLGISINRTGNEDVLVPRSTMLDMHNRIKQLEEENRRLYTENKRLQRREKARVYSKGEPQEKADKQILKFINKMERELDELKSYLPENQTDEPRRIKSYTQQEMPPQNAAEDLNDDYGKTEE